MAEKKSSKKSTGGKKRTPSNQADSEAKKSTARQSSQKAAAKKKTKKSASASSAKKKTAAKKTSSAPRKSAQGGGKTKKSTSSTPKKTARKAQAPKKTTNRPEKKSSGKTSCPSSQRYSSVDTQADVAAARSTASGGGKFVLDRDTLKKAGIIAAIGGVLLLAAIIGSTVAIVKSLNNSGGQEPLGPMSDTAQQQLRQIQNTRRVLIREGKEKNKTELADIAYRTGLIYLKNGDTDRAKKHFLDALNYVPDHYKANLELGKLFFFNEQLDPAREHLRLAIKRAPRDDQGDLHLMLGQVYLRKKEYQDARDEFNLALKFNPKIKEAHYYNGEVDYQQKQYPRALPHYERELSHNPGHVPSLRRLADIYKRLNRPDDAARTNDKLSKLKNDPDSIIRSARYREKKGKPREALKIIDNGLRRLPKNARLHLERARLLRGLKEYRRAEKAAKKAVEHDPNSAQAHLELGKIYFAQKDYKNARDAFDRAKQLDPKLADAHYWLGLTHLQLKKPRNAENSFQDTVKVDPRHGLAWLELGNLRLREKRYREASRAYTRAEAYLPENGSLFYNHALALHHLKRWRPVIDRTDKAKQNNTDPAQLYYLRGNAYLRSGDTPANNKAALENANTALKKRPKYPECHFTKGTAYRRMENYRFAEKHLKEATRQKSDYGEAYYQLGLLYLSLYNTGKTDDRDAALADLDRSHRAFQQAVKHSPDLADAHLQLGWVLGLKQQYAEAVTRLDEAIKRGADKATAYYYKGRILVLRKRLDEAMTAFNAAVQHRPDNYRGYFGRHFVQYRRKNYSAMSLALRQALRRGIDRAGDRFTAYYRLGTAAFTKRQYQTAIREFRRAEKTGNPTWQMYYRLALAYTLTGNTPSALTYYRKAYAVKRDYPPLLHNMAVALTNTNKYTEAAKIYRQSIQVNPSFRGHVAYRLLGDSLVAAKDPDGAVKAYKDYLAKAESGKGPVYFGLGQIYFGRKQYERAHQQFSQAAALVKTDGGGFDGKREQASVFYMLGLCDQHREQYHEAVIYYKRALAIDKNFPEALRSLGGCYIELKKPAEALPHLLAYHKQKPADEKTVREIAGMYVELKNTDQALAFTRKYLQAKPRDIEMNFQAAELLRRSGQNQDALAAFEKVIDLNKRLGQGDQYAKQARQAVQQLKATTH